MLYWLDQDVRGSWIHFLQIETSIGHDQLLQHLCRLAVHMISKINYSVVEDGGLLAFESLKSSAELIPHFFVVVKSVIPAQLLLVVGIVIGVLAHVGIDGVDYPINPDHSKTNGIKKGPNV